MHGEDGWSRGESQHATYQLQAEGVCKPTMTGSDTGQDIGKAGGCSKKGRHVVMTCTRHAWSRMRRLSTPKSTSLLHARDKMEEHRRMPHSRAQQGKQEAAG